MPNDVPSRPRSQPRWLAGALVSAVVIFALFALMLWWFGFFSFSGPATDVKIVAASIALVGGLIGSLVTLSGLILKHSIDQRTIVLQEDTEARRRSETKQAEDRLKVEAAIRAIGLLSTSSGQEVPRIQRAGVILALGDLERLPLALALTNRMLRTSSVDVGTACWLINKALTSEDTDVAHQAGILTYNYTAKMLEPDGGAVFPAILLREEIMSLKPQVRMNAIYALADILMMRPYSEWNSGTFLAILDSIRHVWIHEQAQDIREVAGIALHTFIQAYAADEELAWRSGRQSPSQLAEGLARYANLRLEGRLPDGRLRSDALADWANRLEKNQPPARADRESRPPVAAREVADALSPG